MSSSQQPPATHPATLREFSTSKFGEPPDSGDGLKPNSQRELRARHRPLAVHEAWQRIRMGYW